MQWKASTAREAKKGSYLSGRIKPSSSIQGIAPYGLMARYSALLVFPTIKENGELCCPLLRCISNCSAYNWQKHIWLTYLSRGWLVWFQNQCYLTWKQIQSLPRLRLTVVIQFYFSHVFFLSAVLFEVVKDSIPWSSEYNQ